MEPTLYVDPPSSQSVENFGSSIEGYYAYIDGALATVMEAHGPSATIIVISDHGMKPINRDARFDPDYPLQDVNSAEHQDAPPGVFFAAGPPIRQGPARRPAVSVTRTDLPRVGSVLDIAPTILAMLRIPVGLDMDGRSWRRSSRMDFTSRISRTRSQRMTRDTSWPTGADCAPFIPRRMSGSNIYAAWATWTTSPEHEKVRFVEACTSFNASCRGT